MLTEENMASLRACENSTQWNRACDAIKKEHGGYPRDWWTRVVVSGFMSEVSSKFKDYPMNGDGSIRINGD